MICFSYCLCVFLSKFVQVANIRFFYNLLYRLENYLSKFCVFFYVFGV